MKSIASIWKFGLAVGLVSAGLACSSSTDDGGGSGSGGRGSSANGGAGGSASATGGSSGSGGSAGGSGGSAGGGNGGSAGSGSGGAGDGGSGGAAGSGSGGAGEPGDAAGDTGGATSDAAGSPDAPSTPSGPHNYGKVGELVLVPLEYTAQPVPPIIAPECNEDPTMGFTEYKDSFVIQRPYDLAGADRFKYENGIYTFWVNSNDKAHAPGNGTKPRTEARFSDNSTGEHIWSADVMYESPSKTCVEQIHNVVGAIAVYLRVIGDRMFNLSTGKTILTGSTGKWFNLKVYFDTKTRQVKTYVNNCLKETSTAPSGTPFWYFKHGVYTCDSGTCKSNYKNIHLWERGSTDKYNMRSTYK